MHSSFIPLKLTIEPSVIAKKPHFSGYNIRPDGGVRLFLPGFYSDRDPEKYTVTAKNGSGDSFNMVREGDYWVTKKQDDFSIGGMYQFLVEYFDSEKQKKTAFPVLDNIEFFEDAEGKKQFNKISDLELSFPRQVGPIAKVLLDRLDSSLKFLMPSGLGVEKGNGIVKDEKTPGLSQIVSGLERSGFSGVSLAPFNGGGDHTVSRYTMDDPFALNPAIGGKEGFKKLLLSSMKENTRLFASGMFINQSIDGIQYQANLRHQYRSPFWNWFQFNDLAEVANTEEKFVYPKEAKEKKMALGFLPFQESNDFEQFDYRILNEGPENETEGESEFKKPLYIEFYNPLMGRKGMEEKYAKSGKNLFDFKWKVEITPEELERHREEVRKIAKTTGHSATPLQRKLEFLEWDRFKIVTPYYDASSKKWDGQTMVAKLNLKNPDVIHSIHQGFLYWTRFAQNTYVDFIARDLSNRITALSEDPKKENTVKTVDWLKVIENNEADSSLNYNIQGFTSEELVSEFMKSQKNKVSESLESSSETTLETDPLSFMTDMAKNVIGDYPVSALDFPAHFKQILTAPKFQKNLEKEPMNYWPEQIMWFLKPLVTLLKKIPIINRFFEWLENSTLFRPVSFETELKKMFSEALKGLSDESLEKLKNPDSAEMMTQSLSEFIYLNLLTGQEKSDPKSIEEGLYKTLEEHILVSDPLFGVRPLIDFMKRRLKEMSSEDLAAIIEKKLAPFNNEALSFARFFVEKQEFGMNWQLDSIEDVADLDEIRIEKDVADDLDEIKRKKNLEERNTAYLLIIKNRVIPFWEGITQQIHQISPKSAIIANMTYDSTLCDWETFKIAERLVIESKAFTTMSMGAKSEDNPVSLVHTVPSSDSQMDTQNTPYEYFSESLKPLSQELPLPIFRHYLSVLRGDPKNTLPNDLLFNPTIANMDKRSDWGLLDYLDTAVDEFQTKKCFKDKREELKALGVINLSMLLKNLTEKAQRLSLKEGQVESNFSEDVRSHLTPESREKIGFSEKTPLEIKKAFVQELFQKIDFETLNRSVLIGPEQKNFQQVMSSEKSHQALGVLEQALLERMSESSAARAMRAVLVNHMDGLKQEEWRVLETPFLDELKPLSSGELQKENQLPQLRAYLNASSGSPERVSIVEHAFHESLNDVIKNERSRFGKQSLESALDMVFDNSLFKKAFKKQLGLESVHSLDFSKFKKALKQELYQKIMGKVKNKLLRVVASEVALPGDFILEMPDLLGQTGDTWLKNRVSRTGRLRALPQGTMENPMAEEFMTQISNLLLLRKKYPVLAQGQLLSPVIQKGDSVLPIIRDDGENQAIMLINSGTPQKTEGVLGTSPVYPSLDSQKPVAKNYHLDLSAIQTPVGTVYTDGETGEEFKVSKDFKLISKNNPAQGIDVESYRLLTRKNKNV